VTLSRSEVQRLLAEHGIRPSKALGQNFVADPNTVERIARLADLAPGSTVVEVGAGLGSLTLALVGVGARVLAIDSPRVCPSIM
jgi:16S rRNA (adenine1518-N6/adenine1519-N6)-dimethyltransferase